MYRKTYEQKTVRERAAGERTIGGTAWPVVRSVVRERSPYNKRPRWLVRETCNGFGEVWTFSSRAAALAAL